MAVWNWLFYTRMTNISKLKVSDREVTLGFKRRALSFGEEIKIGDF